MKKMALAFVASLALTQGAHAMAGTGLASWYGNGLHGRPTASGEIFDQSALTAAHPSLPFGARVRVRDVRSGATVVVRINDRGPFAKGRIIDLSREAARVIGLERRGVGMVRLEVLSDG